ncbi:hypothetical protein K431DRAFT_286553 [Polychaeton citri CBS 116435]|uniref:Actin-crosslinking protein n=1 Tax=Polychaeton citri CBS 116435 TaxID=1314669 RepID=A0A9P4Q4U5_9PEZI|nr:hypothetical protein K431DRAFT_286553 [Polychaeton citri CBS 116435]
MVKPLSFKGDKKVKKRKRTTAEELPSSTYGNDGGGELAPATKYHEVPTTTAEADEDEENTWVSADALLDIAGPTVLVLATSPPTCLACDAMGRVFTSKLENLVDGRPGTAEPHDVRQVWVANRVVGSEGRFTLKGFHGRYLGCDKYGLLFATKEAVSQEETFSIRLADEGKEEGMFEVQTMRETLLSVDGEKEPPEPRGDAKLKKKEAKEGEGEMEKEDREDEDDVEASCRIRIRMQAKFKPKHKVEKAERVRAKISRKELEDEVGRRLEDDEVKKLKKARREGNYHEAMLDVKVKGKHDKFA